MSDTKATDHAAMARKGMGDMAQKRGLVAAELEAFEHRQGEVGPAPRSIVRRHRDRCLSAPGGGGGGS